MVRLIRVLEIQPLDLMEIHHKELEILTSIRMDLHLSRLGIHSSTRMGLPSSELAIQHLVLTGLPVKKLVAQHSAIELSNLSVKPTRLRRSAYFRSLACSKPALFRLMVHSPAFTFSSVYSLGFGFLAGLRLWVLRQFQAFLASSPCAASATSYHFSSIALPWWRSAFSRFVLVVNLEFPVLASGSNISVKPTRILRSAYLAR